MGNCAYVKIAEVALGFLAIFEVDHIGENDQKMTLAVSLVPMTDSSWSMLDVKLAKNQRPSAEVLRAVLNRFRDLGVLVAGPPPNGTYTNPH